MVSLSIQLAHRGYGLAAAMILGVGALPGADLCVNQGGTGGCHATIGAAVTAAGAGDVIRVANGKYFEDVVVTKPLALLGESREGTIIDATHKLNGINVDGYNHPGLAHVVIRGFTVQNADAQGILATNASDVTISGNELTGNDRMLTFGGSGPTCPAPGFPVYFRSGEGFDCGEAIHLSGVDHSIVAHNLVHHNAGGILLSDDTGQTHDNLITGNRVEDNPYDCGITLASHNIPAFYTPPPPGVYHNRIIGNRSVGNGLSTGEGAGVGLFAAAPGAQNYGNTVAGNELRGNALSGVAMHSHAPGQALRDQIITGNRISANGSDGDVGDNLPTMGISITSAVVPVTGIVISGNVFHEQGMDIAVNVSNPASATSAHFNMFSGGVGVGNLGAGSISATENWWKCPKGPGAHGCATAQGSNIMTDPWLTTPE